MDCEKLRRCELFHLAMDGTLYLGDEVFPGAAEFIAALENTGRRYIYLTNNSSRAGADYVRRLNSLGLPCGNENIFTSGMASAMYLREKFPEGRVYPVGTAAFCRELECAGVRFDDEAPDAVIVGFDTELRYEKLEKAVRFLRRGAAFIAANPDLVCPMPRGEVLPDCGSICALLTASTGREPLYIGKPNRNMVDIISRRTGVPNARICCVGDRLYTDIAVAKNAGAVSVLVLSGETDRDMLAGSDIQPDYTLSDIRAISRLLLCE